MNQDQINQEVQIQLATQMFLIEQIFKLAFLGREPEFAQLMQGLLHASRAAMTTRGLGDLVGQPISGEQKAQNEAQERVCEHLQHFEARVIERLRVAAQN